MGTTQRGARKQKTVRPTGMVRSMMSTAMAFMMVGGRSSRLKYSLKELYEQNLTEFTSIPRLSLTLPPVKAPVPRSEEVKDRKKLGRQRRRELINCRGYA